MEIKFRKGIGALKFGLPLEEVKKILGAPDEEYDTREEYISDYLKDCEILETPKYSYFFGEQREQIVCKYHKEKLIISIEPFLDFGLCYFYTSNKYITYDGELIMGADINELRNSIFKDQEMWAFDAEGRKGTMEYRCYKLGLKLITYCDKVTAIELEAPYDQDYCQYVLEI